MNSSTNVSKTSEFIVYTRLSFKNENYEELLFGKSLKKISTREDIFS